jgi:hypothetical protein
MLINNPIYKGSIILIFNKLSSITIKGENIIERNPILLGVFSLKIRANIIGINITVPLKVIERKAHFKIKESRLKKTIMVTNIEITITVSLFTSNSFLSFNFEFDK